MVAGYEWVQEAKKKNCEKHCTGKGSTADTARLN